MRQSSSTLFWRHLTTVWTFVFFFAILVDFLTGNSIDNAHLLMPMALIYCTILAIYSGKKEFKRWHGAHIGIHAGEVFVVIWTLLVFGFLFIATVTHHNYRLPDEVSASYIVVLGILAITRESKHFYGQEKYELKMGGKNDGKIDAGSSGRIDEKKKLEKKSETK